MEPIDQYRNNQNSATNSYDAGKHSHQNSQQKIANAHGENRKRLLLVWEKFHGFYCRVWSPSLRMPIAAFSGMQSEISRAIRAPHRVDTGVNWMLT
jgi:hypothetical protein